MSAFREVAERAVLPALAELIPFGVTGGRLVVTNMLAIGFQESRLCAPYQYWDGPARGLWQFEPAGVAAIFRHHRTVRPAVLLCKKRGMDPFANFVCDALAHDDVLAAAFARLLLWSSPFAMPARQAEAWEQYKRLWRPGKPDRQRWVTSWNAAGNAWLQEDLASLPWPDPAEVLRGTGALA